MSQQGLRDASGGRSWGHAMCVCVCVGGGGGGQAMGVRVVGELDESGPK